MQKYEKFKEAVKPLKQLILDDAATVFTRIEKEEEKIQFNLKIASAKVTKSKSEVSGDTSIQTKLHDGKFMMAISDGMGSRTKS